MIQRTWSEIPYSTEQGIFAKQQGICTRETAKFESHRFPNEIFQKPQRAINATCF
jgi:hypothetical protein